jgi:hypothetical protein
MDDVLARADERQRKAQNILADLGLMDLWRPYGMPYLVGAAAYGLVVAPDIDLEVFCPADPRIEDGFEVLKACAMNRRVRRARYANRIDDVDQGYYWMLRYDLPGGEEWKIDMWSVRYDHPGPTARDLVEPMRRALTAEMCSVILEIKEAMQLEPAVQCASIHVYRAVLDGGVRSLEQFQEWRKQHWIEGLIRWTP